MDQLEDFVARVFRASPGYELVLYDRLPDTERHALAALRADPDLYGVLKPRDGTRGTLKTVGRDTALLYLTLREPGPLPSYVRLAGGGVWRREIAQLVLDGVLEVGVGAEFRTGPAAATLLTTTAARPAATRIGELSQHALRFASVLDTDDPNALAAALYAYNRVPIAPRRAAALRERDARIRLLGIAPAGEPGWMRLSADESGWLVWRRSAPAHRAPASGLMYKLYVSPTVDVLSQATRPVFGALARSACVQLKIGAGVSGLARPDKIVAYFPAFEDLSTGAEQVRRAIAGAPAHGVPFTADIDAAGLLSWGMDPPPDPQLQSWRGIESWRAWVTNRLGLALSQARQAPSSGMPPWTFALERLRLAGVDVERWTPNPALWTQFVQSPA